MNIGEKSKYRGLKMSYTDAIEFVGNDDFKAFRAWCYEGSCIQQRMGLFDEPPTFWVKLKLLVDKLLTYKQANLALTDPQYFKSLLMDLSQLKWLKNVRHPTDGCWAYDHNDMQIPEARVFCLNWKSKNDRRNAQQPQKGDLIALVQCAKVTHIVEVLDDVVYDNNQNKWGIYRLVKAVWMPSKSLDWNNIKNIKEIFSTNHLPPTGSVYNFENMAWFKTNWRDSGELQGFQQHVSKLFIE
jgi:hypothetical protein